MTSHWRKLNYSLREKCSLVLVKLVEQEYERYVDQLLWSVHTVQEVLRRQIHIIINVPTNVQRVEALTRQTS